MLRNEERHRKVPWLDSTPALVEGWMFSDSILFLTASFTSPEPHFVERLVATKSRMQMVNLNELTCCGKPVQTLFCNTRSEDRRPTLSLLLLSNLCGDYSGPVSYPKIRTVATPNVESAVRLLFTSSQKWDLSSERSDSIWDCSKLA